MSGTPEASPAALEAAGARLKAAGLRITGPRMAILAELIRRRAPAGIEQIHRGIRSGACDRVTVYRCMEAFEGIGLVRRALSRGGTWLYAIELGGGPRYHVICGKTGRVEEIDAASAADVQRALLAAEEKLRARGYTGTGHFAEFFGTAPSADKT
jgi:Fur family ferric uptake transcriptional regulator